MGRQYHGQLQLASKGQFYNGALPDGILNVDPWGTQEERLIISPAVPFTEILNRLIKRLTDCPMDPLELLLVDRWHLFIYMRCLSYGGEYSFNFKCDECSTKNRSTIDLELDLDVTYADDKDLLLNLGVSSLDEPFTLALPMLGKIVRWRMLRGSDEVATEKYVSNMRSKGSRRGALKDEDQGYIFRLARRIVDIDGVQPSISDALELIESLKGKDALALRQAIQNMNIGIEQELRPKCDSCGWENEIIMPLDKTFFRLESRVA